MMGVVLAGGDFMSTMTVMDTATIQREDIES